MDDESAEIELLEQNLNKTRLISQRMTSILISFDKRLNKLESSVRPLYESSKKLNLRASNLEKALIKIDEVASNQEGIAAEEALILRGPQPGQLEVYRDTLERLNAAIAFQASDRDARNTARLVETGAKKLSQLYTKLVAEGSSGPSPIGGLEFMPTTFPPEVLDELHPLVTFLRTLPLPATHPSHPAATQIQQTLKEAQRGYAEMRGSWSRKGLETYGKRVIDRADTVESVVAGREFGTWVDNLIVVAEDEYNLLIELSPFPNQPLSATYNTLLTPLLNLFSSTLSSLISLIKRSINKQAFLALASYKSLTTLQPRWNEILDRREIDPRRDVDELKEGLNALRAVCLRSFPEFLADIKIAGMGKAGALDTNTGLADFMLTAVEYLGRIPDVQEAAGSALLSLGDGNWRMGDGMPIAKSNLGPGDEPIIIEHFIYDVVNTVITSLNALSKQKRVGFGSIFLLNNVSYLRMNVLLNPRNLQLPSLLSQQTQDVLNSNFRVAKADYFSANFMPLLQTLAEDPSSKSSGGGKAATKEKFTRFFDLLEELAERHRMGKVLEDDPEGRDTIVEEVVKLVVPSLQKFTQRNREKEFSKNPQKYIKLSADEVESQIRGFYR